MQNLADISEISSQQLELLEAAGFQSKEALGKADPADVYTELKRANEFLKLSSETPEQAEVEIWIAQCAGTELKKTEGKSKDKIEDKSEHSQSSKSEDSQSLSDEVLESQHSEHLEDYVQQVECAIPLPPEAFKKAGIALSEVAMAKMLSQCDEHDEVKVSKQAEVAPAQRSQQDENLSQSESQKHWPEGAFAILPEDALTEEEVDLETDREAQLPVESGEMVEPTPVSTAEEAKLKQMEENHPHAESTTDTDSEEYMNPPNENRELSESNKYNGAASRSATPTLGVDASRVRTMEQFQEETNQMPKTAHAEASLSKMTRAETNKGISRSSRRYIRGVLHNQKAKAYFGAAGFIVFWLTCWLPLIGLGLYLLDTKHFGWALYTPAIWLLSLILYFGFALKTSCPVCRQKQFFPKACVKHKNAHKIAGLGLMLPAALHIVLFRWARCIFCGTSLRYKE